jgi:Sulfotransferase family
VNGPILLHIGYHKTGSGWLRRLFFPDPRSGFGWLGKDPGKHPIRRLVREPALRFDVERSRARFEELARPSEEAGLVPALSFERLTGHPFSGGYDGKEIADRLAAVFPTGRVLAVVREQRAIIRSIYKQYVRDGGGATLEEFLDPPTTPSARGPLFDLGFYEYDRLHSYYRRLFGTERVLVLAYEQFVGDPAAFVRAIADFMGRPLAEGVVASLPFTTRSNRSPGAAGIELARRINRLGGVPSEIAPAPLIRSKRLKRLARRAEGARFPGSLDRRLEARLSETIDERVSGFYAESNRRTAELTGLPLSSYGWEL